MTINKMRALLVRVLVANLAHTLGGVRSNWANIIQLGACPNYSCGLDWGIVLNTTMGVQLIKLPKH